MSGTVLLLLSLAGGVGAALRYIIISVYPPTREGSFPVRILIINVTGSFVLGTLTGLGEAIAPEYAAILGVGLIGGYTTFSTVQVETVLLARRGQWSYAVLNLFGTIILAVASAFVGLMLGTRIVDAVPG